MKCSEAAAIILAEGQPGGRLKERGDLTGALDHVKRCRRAACRAFKDDPFGVEARR